MTGSDQHPTRERHRDVQDADWFQELVRRFTRNSEVDRRPAGHEQAGGDGVALRPPPALRCTNYLSYPHSQLKPMVTQDVSPDDVGAMGELYTQAGNAMVRFQNEVTAAIAGSQTQWEGPAGDAARRFMADTADWVGRAGQSAQFAGAQLALHSAALAEAKNSMPEERPFDYDAAMRDLQTTTDPLAFATKAAGYAREYQASRAAHEEAARVVGAYDSRLSAAAAMPAFSAPPTMSGATSSAVDTGFSAVDQRGTGSSGAGPAAGHDPADGRPRDTPPSPHLPPGDRTPPRPPAAPLPPAPRTGLDGGGPTAGAAGAGRAVAGGSGAGLPGQGGPGGQQPGGACGSGGSGSGGTTPAGHDPLPSGPSATQAAPVPLGSAGPHHGALPVGGFPAGPGAGGVRGDADRGGGPGVRAGEPAGRRGAAGARGAAEVSVPAARGRGPGGDERRSYLVDGDQDEVFGAAEATAPPVIGG